jgi:serine/threonine protein kinase
VVDVAIQVAQALEAAHSAGIINRDIKPENVMVERKSDPILNYSTGAVYVAMGKRAEALQVIKELEAMSGASLDQAHWIAKLYAALNDKDRALTWLERGLAAGSIGALYKDDPVWDAIRSYARFGDLLRQMVIPQ